MPEPSYPWQIHEFIELPSTNLTAKELLSVGEAEHGLVIQTAHQTAGRGRFATRPWNDERGQSLLMSIVLRELPTSHPEYVSYIAALALQQALGQFVEPSRIRIKWPNDLQIDGLKVAGILSEAVWTSDTLRGVVLGIGINVRQPEFASVFERRPNSIYIASGKFYDITTVRDAVLAALAEDLYRLHSIGAQAADRSVLRSLSESLLWMKELKPFNLTLLDGRIIPNVRYLGISDIDGSLLIENAIGETVIVRAGTLD